MKIAHLGNSVYRLTLLDGKTSTFYYANGLLTKVESEIVVGHITFLKK